MLQRSSFQIEKLLQEVSESFIETIASRLKDYYSTIPRLEVADQPPEAVQGVFAPSGKAWRPGLGRAGERSELPAEGDN